METIQENKEADSKEYGKVFNLESDGLRKVEIENKYFLIDKKGNKVSQEYDEIYKLESDGLRKAKIGNETFKIKA